MILENKQPLKNHRVCSRCIIDDTVPGVRFDEKGVCNYCSLHEALENDWPLGETGQQRLIKMVTQIKDQGKGKRYDCVVGVSGGTDSTYTLYLAKKLGLRPLAVHFDNGWNTETSVSNIKNALSKLEIDLQTYVVDWEEFKDIQVAFLKAAFPWADLPSDIAIRATLYHTAAEEGINYIILGNTFRTEGKMPAEWTTGDGTTVKYIQSIFGTKKIRSFPNFTFIDLLYYQLIKRIRIFQLLNYVSYSKTEARNILKQELDWEYYGGHHYENIYSRFAYSFWMPQKFGIDKRIITHAALVRNNELTRSQALEIIHQPPLQGEKVEEDVEYVIKKLSLDDETFNHIMNSSNKSVFDYPNYMSFIQRNSKWATPLIRLILGWTPPFVREVEMRRGVIKDIKQNG